MVTVSFIGLTNMTYTLESSDAVFFSQWIPASISVAGTGGILQLSDTNAPSGSRFYRVRATIP
jgi:hypothetical protein